MEFAPERQAAEGPDRVPDLSPCVGHGHVDDKVGDVRALRDPETGGRVIGPARSIDLQDPRARTPQSPAMRGYSIC